MTSPKEDGLGSIKPNRFFAKADRGSFLLRIYVLSGSRLVRLGVEFDRQAYSFVSVCLDSYAPSIKP